MRCHARCLHPANVHELSPLFPIPVSCFHSIRFCHTNKLIFRCLNTSKAWFRWSTLRTAHTLESHYCSRFHLWKSWRVPAGSGKVLVYIRLGQKVPNLFLCSDRPHQLGRSMIHKRSLPGSTKLVFLFLHWENVDLKALTYGCFL